MEKYRKTVDPAHPYQGPNALEWDNTDFETFIKQHLWTKTAKEYMRVIIRSISSMEPSEQSVLALMMSVAGSGGFEPMLEVTEESAQGLKVKDDEVVTVSCQNGLQVTGQRLIIATPPSATDKITFEPILPVERREIHKRYVFGDYIKVIVTYEEEFLAQKGFSW
ncbi:amine oxidase [flavin-containing] A-like [Mizuhopecten yessoensis]|uniref:amine oxidase [flavin-containing] A-like n=1 Tax=Mizuhopecten yessoensis TaxID=6573 RepID=UPI000B45C87B|nr:amine oxidase [flavin-containing] A-like [Mizuhopecten yessoensis]